VLRQLRWQIALALGGVLVIGAILLALSNRAFQDRPARGGELVEAVVGRPATFNPLFAVTDSEVDVVRLVFSGLTRPGADGFVQPDLATGWSVSPDGRTYTFTLRDKAVWHDGQPVTAHDVVFTAALARAVAADAVLGAQAGHLVPAWAQVTAQALDDRTVRFTMPEAYAPFLDATTLGVLPQHILTDGVLADLPNHRFSRSEPIGCGPYRLDLPGGLDSDTIRLVRFDRHWGATDRQPFLDHIVFRLYPTVDTAVAALGQHEVQAMGGVPFTALDALGEDARLYAAHEPGYALVYLNAGNVPFNDPEVRRALSLALDRAALVQDPGTLDGQGVVAVSPIAPGSWAYDRFVIRPRYDPDGARAMLDDAGWIDSDADGVRDREGQSLRFGIGTRDDPLSIALGERVVQQWQRIGVAPTLQAMNQPGTVSTLANRAFDALLFSWTLPQRDPDPYPLWHSSQVTGGQNYAGFADPAADETMVTARHARPDDLAVRRDAYRLFQERFVTEQPALMLYHPVYAYVVVDPVLGGVQLPQLIIDPADRFITIADWYARTERVFRDR
jgi:peptide/nickel transport system substrate-binding protein